MARMEVQEVTLITEPEQKPRRRRKRAVQAEPQPVEQPTTEETKQVDIEQVKLGLMPLVPALYLALGRLEAIIAAATTKVPYSKAQEIFTYTQDEVSMLTEPTAAVLAKHGSSLLGYVDETRLALILVSIHEAKVKALINERNYLRAKKAGQEHVSASVSAIEKQADTGIRSKRSVRTDGRAASEHGDSSTREEPSVDDHETGSYEHTGTV